jgi:hypothetical protein
MSDTAPHLEIAHVLFVDIVGYSKRLINEQRALIERLNRLVRSTEQFRQADAAGKLISIPTGDGMALAFFTAPDAPVRCAIELSKADQDDPKIELRIGIHRRFTNSSSPQMSAPRAVSLLVISERSRGCNAADIVDEARLSISGFSSRSNQR